MINTEVINSETINFLLNYICTLFMGHYTFFTIDFFILLFPLAFSFHPKIQLYKKWKYLIPAVVVVYVVMILWDYTFTISGIWSFNKDYICGIKFLSIPLEEHLFLCYFPFLCVFVYECMNIFLNKDFIGKNSIFISLSLILILPFSVWFFSDKIYTSVVSLCCEFLLLSLLIFTKSHYTFLGKFYMAFALCLIPLFIVNGLLTGIPIVSYNEEYNLNISTAGFPIENILYDFFAILSVTYLYEFFQRRYSSAI